MRWLILLGLLGCAHGPEDPLPTPEPVPPKPVQIVKTPSAPEVCTLSSVEDVKGCTLMTMMCERHGQDYYLVCYDQPQGQITNPPDPATP